ncbi:hypothetical protein [Aeromonas caviae]|uniref:hypothetical protein n=1 Tax=Aeromonas caviae TaxID=648 RepID=UPI0022559DAA|nr:hypothetical protein [Aeromonas caviae]MCX4072918.1 hypothetical protein [Aeromonas caviae]
MLHNSEAVRTFSQRWIRSVDLLPYRHTKPGHPVDSLHLRQCFTYLRVVISQAQLCTDELLDPVRSVIPHLILAFSVLVGARLF